MLLCCSCVCVCEGERKKKEIRMSNLPPALSQHLALMIMNWGLFKLLFALVILAVVTAVQTGPSSILGRATRLKLASGASCINCARTQASLSGFSIKGSTSLADSIRSFSAKQTKFVCQWEKKKKSFVRCERKTLLTRFWMFIVCH